MKEIEAWVRPNIKALQPYISAREEWKGAVPVYLDANENCFGSPLSQNFHRYPDPLQKALKEKISRVKGVPPQNIFLSNGSDEAIDLLFSVFCEPAQDKVLICPPTFGMYEISARIHNVGIVRVNLLPGFELDVEQILESLTPSVKLLFLCSPNNPTANSFHADDMELLVQKFNGIVVIDEAYINYSRQKSAIRWLTEYDNLVVLQTFSKAWGLAALRLGMALASETIIHYLNKVKPPFNINSAAQQYALEALDNIQWVNEHIRETVALREALRNELNTLPVTQQVFPSDANFILLRVSDAPGLYKHLIENGIMVHDSSKVPLGEGCLRITVGTRDENERLISVIKKYIA